MSATDPSTHRPSTVKGRRELFETVVDRLRERLAETDLQLADIAADAFASRRQVQRVLEDHGTTFRLELARLRMDHAALLLASTRLTVREIAALVGYRQPAQFAKAFRAHRGVSPSEFRGT